VPNPFGRQVKVFWGCHLEKDCRAAKVRSQPQSLGLNDGPLSRLARQEDGCQNVFDPLLEPNPALLIISLGDQHLSGHSNHLSERAYFIRRTRYANNADHLAIQAKREVHPFLHAPESASGCIVDLNSPAVGEYQLGPFVAGIEALSLARPNDQALAIHHVHVSRKDGHRSVDDFLSEGVVKIEHVGGLHFVSGQCTEVGACHQPFEQLMEEFPSWIKEASAKGIIG